MATDPFSTQKSGFDRSQTLADLVTPAQNAAIASPSDSADLATIPRGMLLNSGGNVKVDMMGGQTGVTLALPGGVVIPIRPTKIYATGTDAVTIALLW